VLEDAGDEMTEGLVDAAMADRAAGVSPPIFLALRRGAWSPVSAARS